MVRINPTVCDLKFVVADLYSDKSVSIPVVGCTVEKVNDALQSFDGSVLCNYVCVDGDIRLRCTIDWLPFNMIYSKNDFCVALFPFMERNAEALISCAERAQEMPLSSFRNYMRRHTRRRWPGNETFRRLVNEYARCLR